MTGNDSYVPRGMQTLNNPTKQKLVQTQPVGDRDTGCMATSWDMYDTYKALEDASKGSGDGGEHWGFYIVLRNKSLCLHGCQLLN